MTDSVDNEHCDY